MTDVVANLDQVRARIAAACARCGRSPRDVTLVGVSKGHTAAVIAEAVDAGLSDLGENRVQEAAEKIVSLRSAGVTPRWHMIGHLQRNKVPVALDLFDILHTVDSERLAGAIDSQATRRMSVLVEVNVAGEATKHGAAPANVRELVAALRGLPNLAVRGLMTVAPEVDDPEDVRGVFRQMRRMAEELGLPELSMGMTGDFEVAIEEGSTLVRVGRAIFGPRVI